MLLKTSLVVLQTLITSKTRLKLLMKFFLNHRTTSYLRDLESEFGESTNAIRLELNRLEQTGLLTTERQGNKKIFRANKKHPLFCDIHNILLKHTGIDHVVEKVINQLGGLKRAYLVGNFARGKDNPVIDLLLVGGNIDMNYLHTIVEKAEKYINRRIRHILACPAEAPELLKNYPEALLLWENEEETDQKKDLGIGTNKA